MRWVRQWRSRSSGFLLVDELTLRSRYCMVSVGSCYNGLELCLASLENNSELSIQGQALELIPGCGWGQQLWLHQGPIRGRVSPARPAPAGVYVSAPLQETEGDGGRQQGRGRRRCRGVKLWSCKLETRWKIQSYCKTAGKSLDSWRRRCGRKMSSSSRCCWPQFSKASPSRDLPSLPIISPFMLPFKRPLMMDDFWWALLYVVGLWLTSFLSTALHIEMDVMVWMQPDVALRFKCFLCRSFGRETFK